MRILFVVQRYGAEVTGGSEAHCRAIALHLAGTHDVEVVTSCASDYVTWANVFASGTSRDGAVLIRRFPSARQRPLREFAALSERLFDGRASDDEQCRWFRLNGPDVPGLLDYLAEHGCEYDRVIFFTFRYAPSWFGLPLVADRAILMPTAEDDELIRSCTLLGRFFASPRSYFFNTVEEKILIENIVGGPLPPSVTIGCGIDAVATRPSRAILDDQNIPPNYLLYVGRVDRNKGCEELIRHYLDYAASSPGDQSILPLVLAGPVMLSVPVRDGLHVLGRVNDSLRDALLTHARALVMPSAMESLSLVVLEAWNHGTPVLVNARCNVLLGQVRRANGGLYYQRSDDFAAGVRKLSGDPETAHIFGQQGLAYVETEYRWPLVLKRIESILAR
jgi:glycosyltransferase involved in cell wall biosynthesis